MFLNALVKMTASVTDVFASSLPSHDSLRFQVDPVSLESGTEKTTGDESGRHRGKTHSACAELLKDYKGMTEKVNIFAIFKKTPEYLR